MWSTTLEVWRTLQKFIGPSFENFWSKHPWYWTLCVLRGSDHWKVPLLHWVVLCLEYILIGTHHIANYLNMSSTTLESMMTPSKIKGSDFSKFWPKDPSHSDLHQFCPMHAGQGGLLDPYSHFLLHIPNALIPTLLYSVEHLLTLGMDWRVH